MPEMVERRPDELEQVAEVGRFMRHEAQALIFAAPADITPDGITRLLQEAGESVRRAHAERRSALICIAVENRRTLAPRHGSSVHPIDSIAAEKDNRALKTIDAADRGSREERQLMDDDCCCPACCG